MSTRVKCIPPLVVLAFVLVGCTTELKVDRYYDQSKLPIAGAPYSLSFTQYEITMLRRLVACDDWNEPMKVGIKVDIKGVQRPDPMRMYVIDLESLNSFFKTTGASVEYYDSGAIKSLNGSADDKAGEFIAGVATTFGKVVAGGVVGGATIAQALPENAPKPGCSQQTRIKLSDLAALEAEIEQRTATIEGLTTELGKINAVMAADKAFASKESRRQLGQLQAHLIQEMVNLRAATEKSKPLLDALGEKDKKICPPDGETFATASPVFADLDRKLYQSWLQTPITDNQVILSQNERTYQQLVADSTIHLQLKPADTFGRTKACANRCPEDDLSGFKYRIPASGKLLVCADIACAKVHTTSDTAMVSQLGHVYVLPLKSTTFSSKSVKATFAEDGTPMSIGLISAAAADKAGTTLAALGDLAATMHKSRAELEPNDLKAKTELLKAKKDFADATAALQPSSDQAKLDATNAFTVDTTLLNANLAYFKAK